MNIRDLTPNELTQLVTDIENYRAELDEKIKEASELRISMEMRIVDEPADEPVSVTDFFRENPELSGDDEGGNLYIDEGARQASGNTKYKVLDDNDKQVATLTGKGRSWDVYVGRKRVAHGNTKQRAIDAFVETL